MKKELVNIFIFSLFMLGGLNSCTNLDEHIYSEIIADDLKPTEENVISVVAPAYTTMRDVLFGWTGFLMYKKRVQMK